ncbi:MAG: glycine cleavage T C-terminal barrel domain-containing protein, partial [Candidatus Pacebacteria bacterium]|nr:glycine cleavage T C-terminal barrel domain-containing protein [Candidatus Paceibacterota bacterium]
SRAYIGERVTESLGLLYAMHWPYRQPQTARGVRRSPFHDRLAAQGACFGETAGWERPHWFGAAGSKPLEDHSWFGDASKPMVASEHAAVRSGVAAFDISSYGKFMVSGAAAESALNAICANTMSIAVGAIVYTQCLNIRGGIEADVTITRLSNDQFLILTAAGTTRRDFGFFRAAIAAVDATVAVSDVTSGWAGLAIMGPRSRELLTRLTAADLSTAAFPFATAQELEVGAAPVQALRVTYVGSLGWELWFPTEFAAYVFDRVMEVAGEFGLKFAGMHAMDSCRLEKAYPLWGKDLGDETTPLEAGLGFAVTLDSGRQFTGREALLKQRESGIKSRLTQFGLKDKNRLLYKDEPIWLGDRIVGRLSSGSYGHHLGHAVGLGFVTLGQGLTETNIPEQKYQIEIAGERFDATAHLQAIHDPTSREILS